MSLEPANASRAGECGVVKEEREETDGQQEHAVRVKQEPEWTGDLDSSLKCDVKEESGLLELYAGHEVEADLVLGPEGAQPPDCAFNQPIYASSCRRGSNGAPHAELKGSVSPEPMDRQDVGLLSRSSGSNGIASHKQTQSGAITYTYVVDMKRLLNENCLKGRLISKEQIDAVQKPYACEMCMKQFTQIDKLIIHWRNHTGEKPYSCEVCMKRFTSKSTLVKHGRTHSKEKRYSCKVCKKQLKSYDGLVYHGRTHTGEKPYACEVCMTRFISKSDLVQHGRTHEKNKKRKG